VGLTRPRTNRRHATADIAAAIAAAKKKWGRFDIMVNNAGTSYSCLLRRRSID